MYSDVLDVYGDIAGSMSKLSALFEVGRAQLDQAVELDLGSATARVNRDALSAALGEFSAPISSESLEDLAAGIETGLLVQDDTLVAPASVLVDPRISAQLDVNAWRSFGFVADRRRFDAPPRVGELFPTAPALVLESENLRRLQTAAEGEVSRVAQYEQYAGMPTNSLRHPNGGPADPPVHGGAGPHPATGSGYPPGGSPTFVDEYVDAIKCLLSANWTMHWYGPEICLDRACADAIQQALVGADPESFLIALVQLSLKVSSIVVLGSGWVGACIAAGMFYWGAMIAGNKTSSGVCLFIPGPWTFGFMGPGWGVGR